jgi:NAD(P)-dependent dehydrogenase (short-subunit alcohol dehydrogenase family)
MGHELFRYDGKRALVVGGASGMGLATAQVVGSLGADVVIMDVQDPLESAGDFVRVDLTDRGTIDFALSDAGSFDAVFSCAGVAEGTPGLPEINFVGQRYLIESMLAAGSINSGGSIAMISSIGGTGWEAQTELINDLLSAEGFEAGAAWFAARPELGSYGFTKQAVNGYCAARAPELGQRGLRINSTAPGPVLTPLMAAEETWQMFEVGFKESMGVPGAQPVQQAYPLAFLCSEAASFVNGHCLVVDGGFVSGARMGMVNSPMAQALLGEAPQA